MTTVLSPAPTVRRAAPPGPAMAVLKRLVERTGLPMLCVEADGGEILCEEHAALVPFVPDCIRGRLSKLDAPAVFPLPTGFHFYAVPLPAAGGRFVGLGYQWDGGPALPADFVIAAARAGWSEERLARWWFDHPRCSTGPLAALLRLAVSEIDAQQTASATQAHVDQLSEQLDHTYEEITLLHALTRNLQISRGPGDLAALCLDRMPELIDAEGHLIRIETPGDNARTLSRGELPFDSEAAARLLDRFDGHDWSRPLVRNHLRGSAVSGEFPRLANLIAVPIREGKNRFGWIVSANMHGGREFGTVEANFLGTIATILGTHVRNIDLLREQNDLLLGFVRSFVSTLDAKDPYTRGHSERVALIARRVGKEMGLPEDELRTIHLSGLLHDIGKIGVDDRILRKPGPLTDEEFEQVKKHPTVGYNILSGLKNLRHVLPGVRNHHENFDGSGYPDKLVGEEIPLLARVLAVADGYDAMGSNRPYRNGMPVDKIDEIFRRGSSKQWDPRVIDAYFRCREDVRLLCSAYSFESGCPVER